MELVLGVNTAPPPLPCTPKSAYHPQSLEITRISITHHKRPPLQILNRSNSFLLRQQSNLCKPYDSLFQYFFRSLGLQLLVHIFLKPIQCMFDDLLPQIMVKIEDTFPRWYDFSAIISFPLYPTIPAPAVPLRSEPPVQNLISFDCMCLMAARWIRAAVSLSTPELKVSIVFWCYGGHVVVSISSIWLWDRIHGFILLRIRCNLN